MAKVVYAACRFCTKIEDVSVSHPEIPYLKALLRNSTLDADDKMLFRKIQEAP